MPDLGRAPQRWRRLGRLLPRDVRERIFEPALSDVVYRCLKASPEGRRLPFSVQALAVYLGCTPIATVRLFVRRRQLTRLGRYTLWAAGVVAVVALAAAQVLRGYGAYR